MGASALSAKVENLYTIFAKDCFGIPPGSKINRVSVIFQAKLSRNNTNLYAGRWGFRAFSHFERWDGYYPGYNALMELATSGQIDFIQDYTSGARDNETSKLSNSYTEYSFVISNLFTITEKMLSDGFHITMDKIYQGTLDATLYIKNYRVEVDYTAPAEYYLDINGYIDGASSGGISPAGTADVYINGAIVSDDITDYYEKHYAGTTYEIKDIKANTGYRYIGVRSGALSGTLNSTTTIILEFERIKCTVKISAGSGGTVTGEGTYKYGEQVTIKAIPNAGYKFVQWSDGDKNQTRTFTITTDITLSAEFEAENPLPKFTSAALIYSGRQISTTNKVPAGQGYLIQVGVE